MVFYFCIFVTLSLHVFSPHNGRIHYTRRSWISSLAVFVWKRAMIHEPHHVNILTVCNASRNILKLNREKTRSNDHFVGTTGQIRSGCLHQQVAKQGHEGNTDKICSSDGCSLAAQSFCKTCKYICPDCYNDHKTVRAMKTHVILTLNEAATMQKNESPL